MSHWEKYAKSYLFGAAFVLLTVLEAFLGEFGNLAPHATDQWTHLQWAVAIATVGANAITVILAFLNPTYSKAGIPSSTSQAGQPSS